MWWEISYYIIVIRSIGDSSQKEFIKLGAIITQFPKHLPLVVTIQSAEWCTQWSPVFISEIQYEYYFPFDSVLFQSKFNLPFFINGNERNTLRLEKPINPIPAHPLPKWFQETTLFLKSFIEPSWIGRSFQNSNNTSQKRIIKRIEIDSVFDVDLEL